MGRGAEAAGRRDSDFLVALRFAFSFRFPLPFLHFFADLRGSSRRARKFNACASQFNPPPFYPYPFPFALSLVDELLKSIVAADGGLTNFGGGDSVCSSPAYGLCVLLRPCFYQKCLVRPGERSDAPMAEADAGSWPGPSRLPR